MTYWRRCKVWCVLEDSHIAPMECSEVQPKAGGSMPKLYADREPMDLGEHYPRHVQAMTAEQLHDKCAIAAELAWRDQRLEAISRIVRRAIACGQLEKLEDAKRYLDDEPAAPARPEASTLLVADMAHMLTTGKAPSEPAGTK